MSHTRFSALQTLANRLETLPGYQENGSAKIASYFGENVFGDEAMKKHLPEDAYLSVKAAIQNHQKLNRDLADLIAAGMTPFLP